VPSLPTFDLQCHSTHSDGTLPPAEVVSQAAAAGVELLALTDHDTVDGVSEAIAAGERAGLRVVSGVEMTAIRGSELDVHILAYGIDPDHPGLSAALTRSRADRERRIDVMTDRLAAEGLVVDRGEIEHRRLRGEPVGRPHLYHAVARLDVNRERLAAEGADTQEGFFARYVGEGGRAWAPREWPTVSDAISVIHDAGGVAVWAHPFFDVDDAEETLAAIERFRGAGLDGVECFYPTHTREQVQLLCDHCEAHGLLRTGSADFHGPEHKLFNRFRAFELHGREPELGPIAGVTG
jgi:predicted metal-dependent phosphoesterase TrpH